MLKSPKKRYGVIECPNCRGLELVSSTAKSRRCPYCGKVIKFGWVKVKSLYWSDSPRVASRVLAKLKLERSK
ncbi:MAG: hypothetical protein QXN62_06460 [Candidatus Bathyarchaeia archaeon]|nr:hypothetical protein [Candidatus Bathyarchaeota archaeon]